MRKFWGLTRLRRTAAFGDLSLRAKRQNLSAIEDGGNDRTQRILRAKMAPQNDGSGCTQAEARATGRRCHRGCRRWRRIRQHGGEAQQLWREHQEFRAAFASPEEARAIKELLPGGVRDVLTLREATQSVERIDAAIFSGDARAQSEVVAELARANPAAFRSMFAEAAKVLAGMGQRSGSNRQEAGGMEAWRQELRRSNCKRI